MGLLVDAERKELLAELREMIHDVLARECDNRAVHEFIDGKPELAMHVARYAAELGWTGIGLPESVGGAGLGLDGFYVLSRELGYRAAPGSLLATLAAAQWLSEFASEDHAEILKAIVAGEATCAVPAVPGAPLSAQEGLLSGNSALMLGEPGYAIVRATCDGVDALALIKTGEQARWQAEKAWDFTRPVGRLTCANVRPVLLWPDPEGHLQNRLELILALAIVADNVGGMRAIALSTIEYLKTREQFGKIIGSFQALKHRAANTMLAVELAEQQGAQALDAAAGADGYLWAALAKAGTAETYRRVAQEAVQLHGGVGFTWEFDCHIYLKRARLNEALVGSATALRDRAADLLLAATAEGRSVAEIPE
jgi:alkylation response protein AidB-like acyl-CoA dehydrogenase